MKRPGAGWRAFAALLAKDARRELRSKDALAAGLVLTLLFGLVFALAAPGAGGDAAFATAVLWLPLVFGAAAVASRGLAVEADRGTLDLARLAPVPFSAHGWSRTLLNAALILVVAAFGCAAAALVFAIPTTPTLAAALLLGGLGLAFVATLASGLAAPARSRETLLPILVVPAAVPILQAGIAATTAALRGDPSSVTRTPLLLLASYDLLAAGVSWFLWDIVLEGD